MNDTDRPDEEEARRAAPSPANLQRRREIAEAAIRILRAEGYARLTARKVAAEAGLALGHISYHFSGMDEVLAEAFRLESERLRAATAERLSAAAASPADRLEAFLRAGFSDAFLDAGHLRLRVDLWSAAAGHPALARTERALYDHYRAALEDLLSAMAGADPVRCARVVPLADILMAALDGLWLDWRRRGNREALDAALATVVALARRGLGDGGEALPGREAGADGPP